MDKILPLLFEHPLIGKLYATLEFHASETCYLGRQSGVEHLIETKKTDAHVIPINDYDGSLDSFIILNSWGTEWGDEGSLLVSSHPLFDVGTPKKTFILNTRGKDKQSTTDKEQNL